MGQDVWALGHTVVEKEAVAEGPEAEGQQEGAPSEEQLRLADRTRAQPLLPQRLFGPEITRDSCILLAFSITHFFVCFPLVFLCSV